MKSSHARFSIAIAASILVSAIGCNRGPSRVKPPEIDAAAAAADAMQTFDTDGNGSLDAGELDGAPSLKAALATLDTNSDKKVDEAEIRERIASWQASQAGITRIQCKVLKSGRPVEGAIVTFEPAGFLGDQMRTALDETDFEGTASPSIPKDQRLKSDDPRGLQLGFYKVRISKIENGKETVPAKFNTATTLGQQVANDDPAIANHRIVFEL